MSHQNISPYLLQELPDITDSINYPIQNVQRIKVSSVHFYGLCAK